MGVGSKLAMKLYAFFWSRFGPTDRPLRGSSRRRCRNTNAGPMALTASTLAMLSASISASDFSGRSSLGARMPLAIRILSKVPSRPPTNNSTFDVSLISKPSAHRDSLVTSAPFAARASKSAAPIPPTGIALVDAAMREMYVTGHMHNRGRMIVGSYLTKHMMKHWRIGQKWFEDCLIDWDPAANAMGWQWVAGSGPDAAPYFRIFNPETQAQKFDPQEHFIQRFVAELAPEPGPEALDFYDACPRILETISRMTITRSRLSDSLKGG